MSLPADKPSAVCRTAVEILIRQHRGGLAFYESDSGGLVIVVDEPEARKTLQHILRGASAAAAMALAPEVPEA